MILLLKTTKAWVNISFLQWAFILTINGVTSFAILNLTVCYDLKKYSIETEKDFRMKFCYEIAARIASESQTFLRVS